MAKSKSNKLKQLLSHVNYADTKKHREIYDYLKAHADMAAQPPLHLLLYAINNILHPSFLVQQSPDVLDLLGQIELIRQRAIQNCSHILQLNATYTTKRQNKHPNEIDDGVILLDETEVERVQVLFGRDATDRACFVDLVHWVCLHHVRYLLTLGNAGQVAHHMTAHFGESPEKALPKVIMYAGWDEEEQEKVVGSKKDAEAFILDAYEWEDDQRLPENTAYDDATRMCFERKFPLELRLPRLIHIIEVYLRRVKEVADTLEAMFPA